MTTKHYQNLLHKGLSYQSKTLKTTNRNTKHHEFLVALSLLLVVISLILVVLSVLPQRAMAATNIDSTYKYAWNDVIGWIDFYQTGNVNVTSTQLNGYATSSVGYIALDCATTPNGDICGTSNFKVSNDASGNLTGWAWNDTIGWISFASSSPAYQVTINPSTGDFYGWAWNDIAGWISFNCYNTNTCETSNYKVNTAWRAGPLTATLISSVYDTGVATGVALNNLIWQGDQPSGTSVKFQIASGNSTSTWTYRGPDGTDTTYYEPTGPATPTQINAAFHTNHRYYRYKAFLTSNASRTLSPRVDDVIINWSP